MDDDRCRDPRRNRIIVDRVYFIADKEISARGSGRDPCRFGDDEHELRNAIRCARARLDAVSRVAVRERRLAIASADSQVSLDGRTSYETSIRCRASNFAKESDERSSDGWLGGG